MLTDVAVSAMHTLLRCVVWDTGYQHRIGPGQMGSTDTADQKELSVHAETAGYHLRCTTSKGGRKDLYFFSLQQCTEKDFAMCNWFCATCPDTPMMNMQIAAIQTEHGRVTYDGTDVKVVETTEHVINKPIECVRMASQHELDQQLMLKFGIRID